MKKTFYRIVTTLLALGTVVAQTPRFTPDGQLEFPANYREWIYLSSGLGMTYGPAAEAGGNRDPKFDNVYVAPSAYRAFLETGTWPDKTMLVLEVRSSVSKGSINNGGHYQSNLLAVEAEVKDEARFPGKWAFFGFETGTKPVKAIPTSASCYSCHSQKGAVDNTFVQFYPTLLEIAKKKGTVHVPQALVPAEPALLPALVQ